MCTWESSTHCIALCKLVIAIIETQSGDKTRWSSVTPNYTVRVPDGMLALRPLQTQFWACWAELSLGSLASHLRVASDFQNYCYQSSLRLFRGFCKLSLLKYLSVYWQRTDDQKGKLQDQSSPVYPGGRFACKLMRGHCSSPPVVSLLWFE